MGKVPDFLPNKPTVVGSRGQNVGSGYLNRGGPGVGSPKLPGLSSGGVSGNNPLAKNTHLAGISGIRGPPNLSGPGVNVFSKYSGGGIGGRGISGGLGGGIGSGGTNQSNPYQINYSQNNQGEQGSIGSSGGLGTGEKKSYGIGSSGGLNLPSVTNNGIGAIKSRGAQGSSGGS